MEITFSTIRRFCFGEAEFDVFADSEYLGCAIKPPREIHTASCWYPSSELQSWGIDFDCDDARQAKKAIIEQLS